MKAITYEEWLRNPTPRVMWVWDSNPKKAIKRKVVYMAKGGTCNFPVKAITEDYTDFKAYMHCAEIEKQKQEQRRMTHKELSRWLREKPTREWKFKCGDDEIILGHYNYIESTADDKLDNTILIREDDSDWREPLVEVDDV